MTDTGDRQFYIPSADLARGRALIAAHDAEGLDAWIAEHAPNFSAATRRDMVATFKMVFLSSDDAKAYKLFARTFNELQPQVEILSRKVQKGCVLTLALVVLAGAIGGIVYLVRAILG